MNAIDWIQASRLRTLPLASACVMIGGALAHQSAMARAITAERYWTTFALVMATVVLLQVLSNWANDWGDFENGADSPSRTDRAVASGRIPAASMKRAIVRLGMLAFLCGLGAIGYAFHGTDLMAEAVGLLALGLLAIAAAYRYTAGTNPYGYRGWGDATVLVFFGWIGVGGTACLLSHEWNTAWLIPAVWSGALSMAVLNLNNMRDMHSDVLAGKHTLASQLGWDRAKWYHLACFGLGWGCWWVYVFLLDHDAWRGMQWIALINAFHVAHAVRVFRCREPQALDEELKKVALSTALAAFFILLSQSVSA